MIPSWYRDVTGTKFEFFILWPLADTFVVLVETSYATGIANPCRYFTEFSGSVFWFQHSHCTALSLTQLETVQCNICFPASTMTGSGLDDQGSVLIWATNFLSCPMQR